MTNLPFSDNPSPVLVEAASSIIYAALQIEVKGKNSGTPASIVLIFKEELHAIRELLIQRLGPDFARSAISNHDNYVSPRVRVTHIMSDHILTVCIGRSCSFRTTAFGCSVRRLSWEHRFDTWYTMDARPSAPRKVGNVTADYT